MKKRTIIIIIAGAVLLAVLIVGAVILYNRLSNLINSENVVEYQNSADASGESASGDTTEEDRSAPDFTFVDYEGNSLTLSDLEGKPIVLNFWASWCPPCREEMPYFDEMYSVYKDEVIFLMVNLTDGTQETVQSAKTFYEEQGYTFPIYFDTSGEGAENYYLRYIPDTFFIDKNGDIYSYATGAINADTLEENIISILDR